MKKLTLTIAIVLGLGLTTFADPHESGLFKRGYVTDEEFYGAGSNGMPLLPNHNWSDNFDADAPLGSGVAMLLGLGAAYLIGKRRREE